MIIRKYFSVILNTECPYLYWFGHVCVRMCVYRHYIEYVQYFLCFLPFSKPSPAHSPVGLEWHPTWLPSLAPGTSLLMERWQAVIRQLQRLRSTVCACHGSGMGGKEGGRRREGEQESRENGAERQSLRKVNIRERSPETQSDLRSPSRSLEKNLKISFIFYCLT